MKRLIIVVCFAFLIGGVFLGVNEAQADCPDGTLLVTLPDGQHVVFPGKVACCYKFPACKACRSNRSYRDFVQEHLNVCRGANINRCAIRQECAPF